jgi:hypothetical protein
MSALYMSMSANESDLVIEDDLAKGVPQGLRGREQNVDTINSTKGSPRSQIENIFAVKEELCPREGCSLPRLPHCPVDPEPHGLGRGVLSKPLPSPTFRAILMALAAK